MLKNLPSLAASALLVACAHLSPQAAKDLAPPDPLHADPAGIEAMVTLPDGLRLRPEQALLTVGMRQGDRTVAERFQLRLAENIENRTTRLSLAPADAARFRAWQAQALDLRQSGPAPGWLSVSLGACATGAGPEPDARGSLALKVAADEPMLPVIDQGPLSSLLGAEGLAAIRPCR